MTVSTQEFEDACKAVSHSFPIVAKYLAGQLLSDVFSVEAEDFNKLKTQHEYLAYVAQVIKNVSTQEENTQ